MKTLELEKIRIDGGTQPRVELNQDVITDYADQLRNDATFPPVTVFYDGAAYWLADGFHRYHAHRNAGRKEIIVDIQTGGLREAILYSVGANTEHGLRRTNEDKRKAVETMLTNELVSMDEDGNPWGDREIARLCGVHHTTIGRIRKELSGALHQIAVPNRAVKRGNSVYTQNTAKIGTSTKHRPGLPPGVARPRSSDKPEETINIDLPLNPKSAARTLLITLGREVAIDVAEYILLKVTEPNSPRLREITP